MKTLKFVFLPLLLSIILGDTPYTDTFDLEIVVTNINTLEGTIELGVFNNTKTFLQEGKEYKTYSKRVISDTIVFLLNDFKKDDYAFSIYHDLNSDKECNLSFFGIPKEPFGFSKNFRPRLSRPSFKDCEINVYQDTTIVIRLID